MSDKLTFRQTLLQMLAVLSDLSFKEIGARCGMTERNVSHHLRRPRRRDEIKDDVFERLLSAIPCSPAAVSAVADCIETVAALNSSGDLTAAERAEIEEASLGAKRLTREALSKVALRTRAVAEEGYPEPSRLAPTAGKPKSCSAAWRSNPRKSGWRWSASSTDTRRGPYASGPARSPRERRPAILRAQQSGRASRRRPRRGSAGRSGGNAACEASPEGSALTSCGCRES